MQEKNLIKTDQLFNIINLQKSCASFWRWDGNENTFCDLATIFYIHIKHFLFKGANSKFWGTFKYCFWYLPWEGRFEESPFNDLAHKPKGWCQKKEGDHFTFNGTCSTINCQKGMIDSHSKKLLSRVRSHFTGKWPNFSKKAKNLRKLPKIFENGQK